MKTLSLTLTSLAALSLTACSSLSTDPANLLFAGIPAEKVAAAPEVTVDAEEGLNAMNIAERRIRESTSNPTCAQFNMNALAFAAAPEVPGFGTDIIETVILGTVASEAGGGVAALGISSNFIETAVAGTVNQVVYNGARPVVDKAIPDLTVGGSEKTVALKTSAERVGCPDPTWLSAMTPVQNQVLLTKLNGEALAAQKAAKVAGDVVSYGSGVAAPTVTTPNVTTPTLTAPTVTTPTITAPTVTTPALPVVCPAGTTAQPGGSCLVTGNFGG